MNPSGYLSPSGALSARGISITTAKTSVNSGRHRRTYRQEPGHEGGVGGALKEALHRLREDAAGGRRTCVPTELSEVEGGLLSAPIARAMNSCSSPISPLCV